MALTVTVGHCHQVTLAREVTQRLEDTQRRLCHNLLHFRVDFLSSVARFAFANKLSCFAAAFNAVPQLNAISLRRDEAATPLPPSLPQHVTDLVVVMFFTLNQICVKMSS